MDDVLVHVRRGRLLNKTKEAYAGYLAAATAPTGTGESQGLYTSPQQLDEAAGGKMRQLPIKSSRSPPAGWGGLMSGRVHRLKLPPRGAISADRLIEGLGRPSS
jgi:hypothetical protein